MAMWKYAGNAKGGNWTAYKLFFGSGFDVAADKWQQIGPDHNNQVDNNVLENWNLAGLASGMYFAQAHARGERR